MRVSKPFSNRRIFVALALLIAAMTLGGGGTPNPAFEIVLQLLAAILACIWIWLPSATSRKADAKFPVDPRLLLIAAGTILLPALQLVPLPPPLWQALPGRETESIALELVGGAQGWQPLSLAPSRSWAALLSFGPPLFLMLMAGALPLSSRTRIVACIALIALASAIWGAMQLAAGGDALRLYPQTHSGWITGFQANRNAQADVLLIGMVALAAILPGNDATRVPLWQRKERLVLFLGANALLLFAVIMTGSRMGIALVPVALLAQLAILYPSLPRWRWNRGLAFAATAGVAAFIGSALILQGNAALRAVIARFSLQGEFRPELWADTHFAIAQYWPAGSGMGTFVPAILAAERLEVVDPTMPNRAHNDYLELLLETGIPGIVMLLAIAGLLAALAVKAWRSEGAMRAHLVFSLACFLILALHSIVDYPLRCMSLACLAGIAAGLLARPPGFERRHSDQYRMQGQSGMMERST